jgi:hypothetical protein
MNITVQIFGLEFTNISDTPQPWWVETDYLPKAINCFQKPGLWQNFRYCYNLLADRMHQFDSLEALLELSKSWESKGIYILRHSEASRDYTLHWLLNREGVDSLSPNSLGLSLDIEDTYLQQVQNIEIEQLINLVSDLHSAFKDVMLFGSAVNIRIEGITYPRVLPPRSLNYYFAPCLVNFFSRKFLAQFNKWDAEKKEKLLSLPLPPGCKRIERGDLVILQWVDNLHDVEHISQRLGLQDEWFVGAVNPELDLSYNELGDKRATIPPLSPDNFVTLYSHWGQFGFEAVVPEENYQIEPETLARLQQWLAAGQLPDGKTLTSISLIVPSRTAAIRVREQAKAAGMGPIYYVDNDGNLWRPYPYASLTESPDSQAATSVESSYWFNPDRPAASSSDADLNDIDEEQREAPWEAEKIAFVQEIFDYFQQEQPEWEVDLAPPEDAEKEIFRYLKIGKWSDGEERICEMNIHAGFSCHFLFYSFGQFGIPESKVLAVTELVTRINYGIKFGHLEFVYVMDGDYRSWETRYKTHIEYVDFPLCRAVIRNTVNNSVSGVDKHVQAICAVVEEDVSPAVAAATLVMPTEEMEQNVPSRDELSICSQCLQQMQEKFSHTASLLL